MLSRLCMWILNTLGWTVYTDLPDVDKYVVIAARHTSNWDFPLGILAAKAANLDVHWLGKHTLFRWPFGWFFRAIGGTPVHRGRTRNLIQQIADLFARPGSLVIALAPEGTRSKTDHWKTDFYHIARAAQVPIVMAYLDYGQKKVGIGGAFDPGDDIEAVFGKMRTYFQGRRGKYPEKESQIRVR